MNTIREPATERRVGVFSPVSKGDIESVLPLERLRTGLPAWREAYAEARPFPHLVIDGLWDESVLDRILLEFPRAGQRDWIDYSTTNERKQTSRGLFGGVSPFTQLFRMQVCSPVFLEFLESLTGVQKLVQDPIYHGGGLHESSAGGWLNLHTDWLEHPALPLTRRLNMLVYLNREWDPAWEGALQLCDFETKVCERKVEPIFNRTVIFPTTDRALHGFPDPLKCREGRTRKSIALFYWTLDNVAARKEHIVFLPGRRSTRLKATARLLLPPFMYNAARSVRRSLRPKDTSQTR